MHLHHMHQVGPKAARKSQILARSVLKPFRNNKSSSRRQLTVVAGEARSANRTKWTRRDEDQQLAQTSTAVEPQIQNGFVQQLADIDPHELVSSMLQQQQWQQSLLLQPGGMPEASAIAASS